MSQRDLFGENDAHAQDLAAKRAVARPETAQERELKRVKGGIADHIREFADATPIGTTWHMQSLYEFVGERATVAPASCDRILRDMRRHGELNYVVTNRKKSEYVFAVVQNQEDA